MDAIMGIVGAAVISRWAYGLIKESSQVLLDKSVDQATLTKVTDAISAESGTVIRDIHIWKLAPAHYSVILSLAAEHPVAASHYHQLIKQQLPLASHISIEVNNLNLE